jgi:aconitate hydratase
MVSLVVVAGKEYGAGSSRDWAAKGTLTLGVKAVIAQSFERIHRSNLIGMGVLPLEFMSGEGAEALGLNGRETYSVLDIDDDLKPDAVVSVKAEKEEGSVVEFNVRVRIETPIEIEYYRNGGILNTILRQMLQE